MWLYLIFGALVVLGLAGGAVMGGVFTIVLIPLAVIILLGSLVYMAMGRAAEAREQGGSSESRPLPHTMPGEPSHAPTSPEALADARRVQQ